MIDARFIQDRILQLTTTKGNIAARQISKDLGHNDGYIKDICSHRSLPSMREFLYLCEYFGITPMEFFNEAKRTTPDQQKVINAVYNMSPEDVALLIKIIERLET